MKSRDERLVEVAGSVSDGKPVDWDAEDTAQLGLPVEGLRTLSKVAGAFDAVRDTADDAADVLLRWGPLELIEKLGEGQFGEVFRARDPQLRREVAVKLDRGEGSLVRARMAEAQRLASVRHPNVLTVHGAAIHDGRAGIWTDLLDGSTLEERLEQEGPLGGGELSLVGAELCRALAAVHGAGLVHGDVKTSNVIRERGGRLVLVDFGAARSDAEAAAAIPQGTPAYLAPEVAAGGDASAASDLYALGALLYRLASGEHWSPIGAKPLRDARPDLSIELVTAVERLLSDAPADRPASAGTAERAFATGAAGSLSAKPSASRFGLMALVVTAMLLVAASAWWLRREQGVGDPQVPAEPSLVAHLYEESGGSRSRLSSGAKIGPGDRLALGVELAEGAHLYVFNEDERGDLFVLFPLPGLLPTNPLGAGRHRLPGDLNGQPQSWEVTSAGGKERFLIVASAEPLPELEGLQARFERARSGRTVERSLDGSGDTLRGVGGLRDSETPSDSLLARLHADLLAEPPASVWTEFVVLDNPR